MRSLLEPKPRHHSRSTHKIRPKTHTTPRPTSARCSSASDRDASALFLSLAARSDPDPLKTTYLHEEGHYHLQQQQQQQQHSLSCKAKVEEEKEVEEGLDTSKHSFSEALKECQDRKTRKPRPVSVDFNGTIMSPRCYLSMKNSSTTSSRSKTGSFPSPGTPNYRYPRGWSSERVPLQANSSRRYMAGGAVLPFNNGRAIPSKWEDAEKWIFSPVGNENAGRNSVPPPHHRRPKSKSGPLGPPGYGGPPGYFLQSSAASPLNPCFDSGRVGGFNGSSPFLAGVFGTDRGSCASNSSERGGGGRSSSANAEPCILRSASIHGWSDTRPSSTDTLQDEKIDCNREAVSISSAVLRKDVATQMSPEGSTHSSPKSRHPFSATPSAHHIEELESHFSKLEVRDVQVDDKVTVTRWSKKHIARGSDRRSLNIIEWKKKTVEAKADSSSGWEIAETTRCISKCKREEAKITAWENLQKAKAEAAIRKLEMKLEKKRSSSMDKILNKLRSAQRKAQEMRSTIETIQSQELSTSTPRRSLHFRRNGQSSLVGCFTCPAF